MANTAEKAGIAGCARSRRPGTVLEGWGVPGVLGVRVGWGEVRSGGSAGIEKVGIIGGVGGVGRMCVVRGVGVIGVVSGVVDVVGVGGVTVSGGSGTEKWRWLSPGFR